MNGGVIASIVGGLVVIVVAGIYIVRRNPRK
jgi:hypothetical protein